MTEQIVMDKNRHIAIHIMEEIATSMDDEDMFDGEIWYDVEDMIVKILDKEVR